MRFLSIKDAAVLADKSESSIKRFVNQVKKKAPEKYRDSTFFRFEKLPNGNDKILISEGFLLARFASSKNELHDLVDYSENTDNTNGSHGSQRDLVGSAYKKTIEILEKELDRKNKQLESKDKQIESLLDRNKEINLLFAQAQQREQIKLEESIPKKRWWQRKK